MEKNSIITSFAPDETRNLEHEKQLGFIPAVKKYRRAVLWSMLISTVIIMEAYDTVLIGKLIAFPPFVKKFGKLENGKHRISAGWQSGVTNSAAVGEVFGLYIASQVAERVGYRYCLIGSLGLIAAFIFIVFFAENLLVLTIGEFLCGIPWGAFQSLTVTYAADITPSVLRSYLTSYVVFCWIAGHILLSGVLRALLTNQLENLYRIAFAIQWIWPVPLAIGIWFLPESPSWLVKKGRVSEAKLSLDKLTGDSEEAEAMHSNIVFADTLEKAYESEFGFLDLFKGKNLMRTFVASFVWASLALCGTAITSYSTYFFEQAGLSTVYAFDLSLVQNVASFIGLFTFWSLGRYMSIRNIYLMGLFMLMVLLLIIGCLGIHPVTKNSPYSWAIAALLICLQLVADGTIGPIPYVTSSEVPLTRLRIKTVAFSRNVYMVFVICRGVITPYMMNEKAWNWGAKSGFFWMGFCMIFLPIAFFWFPETKGRLPAEIDYFFEQNIPIRKFHKTQVAMELISEEKEAR